MIAKFLKLNLYLGKIEPRKRKLYMKLQLSWRN